MGPCVNSGLSASLQALGLSFLRSNKYKIRLSLQLPDMREAEFSCISAYYLERLPIVCTNCPFTSWGADVFLTYFLTYVLHIVEIVALCHFGVRDFEN